MLNKYKGCILGAILGDALGMPCETAPIKRDATRQPLTFRRAYHGHPNHDLMPGQYTDDGQILLIAARILNAETFDRSEYAKELLRTHTLHKFRYPDGATFAACKKMETSKNLLTSGIHSDSAGCMALAVPFALRYHNRRKMAEELIAACSITHTHPASHAATLGFALLLNTLLETSDTAAAFTALDTAAENMDPELAVRLKNAYRFEQAGMAIENAASVIGNSSSAYHTLPLAMFLCKRCYAPADLLAAAASCGGNADTITMICGAFTGARFGISALPADLLAGLERRAIFEELAEKLLERSDEKEKEETEISAGAAPVPTQTPETPPR